MHILIEFEIARTDWSRIAAIEGAATNVPHALRELIYAQSSGEANRAYWKLENHVVVQGQLFEAAVYIVPVLLAALASSELPRFVGISIVELLFQIVHGDAASEDVARGLPDLGDCCRTEAKKGLWLLYRELIAGDLPKEGVLEVIEVIDDDKNRVAFIKSAAIPAAD